MFDSSKFASVCEFHLDEYLDEVVKEDDDRRELCDGEERNDEIRHEKRLVLLVATNILIKLAVGKDGNERVPTRHAELGIHLPLADKCHDRDGQQQDKRKEKRTEQGRLTLPIVETRGFSVLRGLPSGTVTVPSGLTSSPRAFRRL